jgi:AraC family transcriptional regulator, regulatory protein of adaptative response / DNA-3-methyladenine glycosylase II
MGLSRSVGGGYAVCYNTSQSSCRCGTRMMTQDDLVCDLAYRAPLDWSALLGYLNGRSILGVEMIEGDRYGRTVDLEGCQGWLTVEPVADPPLLRVRLSSSLGPVRSLVLSRLTSLFDLEAEPGVIAAHLGALALEHPGLRVPGAFDGFEIAVRTILGQQVSVKAAKTVMGRFVQRFSGEIGSVGGGGDRDPRDYWQSGKFDCGVGEGDR